MKNIYWLIIPVLMMIASCVDHRLDGMTDDQLYLLNYDMNDVEVYNFGEYSSDVVICKGGIGEMEADVELELNQELIIRYNNFNGTTYKMLPSNCYEMSETQFHFNKNDIRKVMKITYHTNAMANLPEKDNYIIPLQMEISSNIKFDEDKQTVLVHPEFIEPFIFFPKSGTSVNMPIGAGNKTNAFSFEVGITYRNLVDPFAWDIHFELEPDAEALEAYNASQLAKPKPEDRIVYTMLPADAYLLNSNQWNVAKGKTLKDLSVEFLKGKLTDGDGEYVYGNYALSLKISRVSIWGIDGERNNLLLITPFNNSAFDDVLDWKVLDYNSAATMDDETSTKSPYGMLAGTGWQSKWSDPLPPLPYYFVFDMLTPKTITQIKLHFLTETGYQRNLRDGTFEVSSDNQTWIKIADWIRGTNNTLALTDTPIAPENQIKARYLRFVIDRAINYINASLGAASGARMDIQQLEVIGYE